MPFQSSPPARNQLMQLRNRMFNQHLVVSLPAILIIIIFFHTSPLLAPYPKLESPELMVPQLLTKYYQQLFDYTEFYGSLAQKLYASNLISPMLSLEQVRARYEDIEVGMYCMNRSGLINANTICNKYVALSTLSWQYQNSQILAMLIDTIIVCERQSKQCVSTSSLSLTQFELSLLQSNNEMMTFSPSYILSLTKDLVILLKTAQIEQIHSKILQHLDFTFHYYYRISVTLPIEKEVYSYGQVQTGSNQVEIFEADAQTGDLHLRIRIEMQRYVRQIQYIQCAGGIMSLLLFVLVFWYERQAITDWLVFNFSRKHLINKLYRYTIRDIFTGQKPNSSNILQSGPSSNLFLTLSSLIDKSLVSIQLDPPNPPHNQGFKFISTLNTIFDAYKQSIIPLMESKNKYILTNRFSLQTSINDMFEVESKIIKENFARGAELGIEREMFQFCYMAVLKTPEEFINFLETDPKPMPKQVQSMFIKINTYIHNPSTISTWNLIISPTETETQKTVTEETYEEENKQELMLRTRVYILPKYLTLLKELDSKHDYGAALGFERELKSLADIIENTRFMLTRHNKTIRGFSR